MHVESEVRAKHKFLITKCKIFQSSDIKECDELLNNQVNSLAIQANNIFLC